MLFCQVSFKTERKGNGVKNIFKQMNKMIGHRIKDGCREERTLNYNAIKKYIREQRRGGKIDLRFPLSAGIIEIGVTEG